MERLTRAERKQARLQKRQEQDRNKYSLELRHISPKTQNQEHVFKDFQNGKNLLIHGLPGTGKSFISLYLALNELGKHNTEYNNITIIRSVVPSRDMGFLPGSIKEKSRVYEAPYSAICKDLYGRSDAYDILKQKGALNFETSSFLRGVTFEDTIIIVDECQNMTYSELCTIITRVGPNTKILFCGDYRQTDLKWDDEREGVMKFMKIIRRMNKYFSCVEFMEEDIVRSGLVKDFILKKTQVEDPSYRNNNNATGYFTDQKAVYSPSK
jgi:phosphate starvation-inducible protein PhoH